VVSENSTLVVVNLVGVEKIGDCSLKNVPILRRKKTGRKKKSFDPASRRKRVVRGKTAILV